jgi:hypothetical protein
VAGRLTEADRRGLSALFWTHLNLYGGFELDMGKFLALEIEDRRGHSRLAQAGVPLTLLLPAAKELIMVDRLGVRSKARELRLAQPAHVQQPVVMPGRAQAISSLMPGRRGLGSRVPSSR